MESMRDIRNRIGSVQKTMKITNAMHLMSSSKLKKARQSLAETEPYFLSLHRAISKVIAHTDLSGERFFASDRDIPEDEIRRAYIIITSDRGLAGSYNHNVCRTAEAEIKKHTNDLIICIGQYGKNYFTKHPELAVQLDEEHCLPAGKPSVWEARDLADHVTDLFLEEKVDAVHLVYTQMINALMMETRVQVLLPLVAKFFPEPEGEEEFYTESFDPSPSQVLRLIVPNLVRGMLYGAMVESYASEQNARMTAMDNATKNAKEIVSALSLEYNRIRQANITTQITEVVGGANAQEDTD